MITHMEHIPSPLADAFAALAAELRTRAESGTGQGAQAAWQALVVLGLVRVLFVLESMVRHWQATRLAHAGAAPSGHSLLAARYPRASRPPRRLTPEMRAELKDIIRPYRPPANLAPVPAARVPHAAQATRPPSHPRRHPAARAVALSRPAQSLAPHPALFQNAFSGRSLRAS